MNWLNIGTPNRSWIRLEKGPTPIPACAASVSGRPIGTRVIDSTPLAMTISCVPLITACAANWIACCDEPHWRSIVTAGTLCGRPDASTALRPT